MYDVEMMVTEFTDRTWDNYQRICEIVERNRSYDAEYRNAYEVTQIINSLIGLLLFPYGHYKGEKSKLKEIDQEAYGNIEDYIQKLKDEQRIFSTGRMNTNTFLRALRNAVAHSGENDNLMFYPRSDANKSISHIIFHSGKDSEEFCVKICCSDSNNELKELLENIKSLYSKAEEKIDVSEYDAKLDDFENLLQIGRIKIDKIKPEENQKCCKCGSVPFYTDDELPYLKRRVKLGKIFWICPNCNEEINYKHLVEWGEE